MEDRERIQVDIGHEDSEWVTQTDLSCACSVQLKENRPSPMKAM